MVTHLEGLLTAYLAGELQGAELAKVESHLKDCAECRAGLARLQRVNALLDADAPIEPSASFTSEVMRKIEQEKKVTPFPIRKTIVWLALAAALVFALFLLRIQREVAPPAEITKRKPITPAPAPVIAPAPAPVVPESPKTTPPSAPEPAVPQPEPGPVLTEEDRELIAHLDELQDMELINEYDTLEEMNTAILATPMEQAE